MNSIEDIALEMRRVNERIYRGQKLLAESPEDLSLLAGQLSDKRLMELLRDEFESLAKRLKKPVARYTITGNGGARDIGNIGEILTSYRHLYGLCRTVISTGQKIETFDHYTPFSLSWGYVHDLSGITFGMIETSTVQQEFEFEENKSEQELVDETTKTVNQMISCSQPKELEPLITQLGRGPIKALCSWAAAHEDAGCGVQTEWIGTGKGQVFITTNGKGPYRFTNATVYAMPVEAQYSWDANQKPVMLPRPIAKATTNADGFYSFTVPSGAPFILFAQAHRMMGDGSSEFYEWRRKSGTIDEWDKANLSHEYTAPYTKTNIDDWK